MSVGVMTVGVMSVGEITVRVMRRPPLIAYKKKTGSSKMSTVKIPTFTFYLTQIHVVPFQCKHFFYLKPQGHKIWA
jgi:hypothetical protein